MYYTIGVISIWPLSDESFGGTEKFVGDLGITLSELGHQIEFLSPSRVNKYRRLKHFHLPGLSSNIEFSEYSLQKALKNIGLSTFCDYATNSISAIANQRKYDCLIINSPLLVSTNKTSVGQILVMHDNPDELKNYFGDRLTKQILKRLRSVPQETIIVAPSQYYAHKFSHLIHHSVIHIPHALIHSTNQIVSANKSDILRILVPSRLEWHQKGQDIAIRALSKIKQPARLTLTGYDPIYYQSRKYLYNIADRLGVRNIVNIIRAKDINALLHTHDLILLPSRFESFGYSAQWAIASGLKVIISDIPTFKELAIDVSNNRFFKSGSVANLINALDKSNEIIAKIPSKKWFYKYSRDLWAKKYLAIIRKAINK